MSVHPAHITPQNLTNAQFPRTRSHNHGGHHGEKSYRDFDFNIDFSQYTYFSSTVRLYERSSLCQYSRER